MVGKLGFTGIGGIGALAITLAALGAGPSRAHGVLVPEDRSLPPLGLAHHRVAIEVNAGLATVTIDQTWRNTSDRPLEATYLFPVPKGAVVTGFLLEINGKMQKGELLEREKAKKIYEDIVARLRDPGLVEWMEQDLFQVRIFPVPARGEQRLRLAYAQPVETLAGTYRLTYPLRTAAQVARTLEDFTLTVKLRDAIPIGTVYSPTHKIAVAHRDREVTVGFEAERVTLDKDFVLYFGVSAQEVGMNVIAHRPAGEPGYFLLTAAPRGALESEEVQDKAIVFVLDTSGSMTGDKIAQAKAALRYCIERLGPDDRFDVLRFSSDVERLSKTGLVAASADNKQRALAFVDAFEAAGGTAIDEALGASLAAVANEEGALVLFVTDGRPTVGEVDQRAIVDAVDAHNKKRARIFTLGVGEDLDTHLVDRIAGRHGGSSHYVRPGEDVAHAIAALYEHIAYPVLTGITLTIDGDAKAYAVLPKDVPDLFRGQQLVIAGRYRGFGKTRVRLEGRLGKETRRFEIRVDFPERETEQDFVASLWAHRQVGHLLDQVRLSGETPALREEIVQLAKQYGIVTPYTSWLVVDDSEIARPPPRPPHPDPRPWPHPPRPRPVPPPWLEDREGGVRNTPTQPAPREPKLERAPEEAERIVLDAARPGADRGQAESFRRDGGKEGVDAAETIRILKDKDDAAPVVRAVKRVGGRVFTWQGERWLDQAIAAADPRVAVRVYSAEWAALARRGADVRAALALGERVSIKVGTVVYEVSP